FFLFCPREQQHPLQCLRIHAFLKSLRDPLQWKAEVLERKDAVQPRQLPDRVVAIAGFAIDMHGRQESKLVVVTKRRNRDLRQRGELTNLQHETVVKPLATRGSTEMFC